MTASFSHQFSQAQVPGEELVQEILALDDYRDRLQQIIQNRTETAPEASLLLPDASQEEMQLLLSNFFAQTSTKLRYVVVVGIGGSSLGTRAIYEALTEAYAQPETELLFLETVSSRQIAAVSKRLSAVAMEEFAIVVISKSGSTVETRQNMQALESALVSSQEPEDQGGFAQRVIAITEENSNLWQEAETKGWWKMAISPYVGGRFSVFSAVGLIPLALAGVDTAALLNGALRGREQSLDSDIEPNMAMTHAALWYKQALEGRRIHTAFLFAPELEAFGGWLRQLIAESLGKPETVDGEPASLGIMPMTAIGSTDLHSVAQLLFAYPKMDFTTFFTVDVEGGAGEDDARVGADVSPEGNAISVLDQTMVDIAKATKRAYEKADKPFMEVRLSEITPFTLGALMQSFMMMTMFLGYRMNVNAFDQPQVELYKKEMRGERR